jgi:hypothetical protein
LLSPWDVAASPGAFDNRTTRTGVKTGVRGIVREKGEMARVVENNGKTEVFYQQRP